MIARPTLELSGLEDVNATEFFYHNYMEFVGYKKCDELLQK